MNNRSLGFEKISDFIKSAREHPLVIAKCEWSSFLKLIFKLHQMDMEIAVSENSMPDFSLHSLVQNQGTTDL